jgi:hypothetical protein
MPADGNAQTPSQRDCSNEDCSNEIRLADGHQAAQQRRRADAAGGRVGDVHRNRVGLGGQRLTVVRGGPATKSRQSVA